MKIILTKLKPCDMAAPTKKALHKALKEGTEMFDGMEEWYERGHYLFPFHLLQNRVILDIRANNVTTL